MQVKQAYWDQITSDPLFFINGIKVGQREYVQNYALSSSDPSTSEQLASTEIDYRSCSDRMCRGLGSGNCLTSKTCQALLTGIFLSPKLFKYIFIIAYSVTAKQEHGVTEFAFHGKSSLDYMNKYFSMAFSEDDKMGDDLVVDCYTDSTGNVKVGLSYNHGKSNELLNAPNVIQNAIGQYADGIISCKWNLNKNMLVNGKEFDLVDKKYHILLAHGAVETDEGEKSYHDLRTPSAEPVNLASVGQLSSKDLSYLIRIHGLCVTTN